MYVSVVYVDIYQIIWATYLFSLTDLEWSKLFQQEYSLLVMFKLQQLSAVGSV